MKITAHLAVANVLIASILMAFSAHAQTSLPGSALPPPGINDPGSRPVAPARKAPAQAPASTPKSVAPKSAQSTELPAMQDVGSARDARNEPPPEVRVHQQGTDNVQEYSRNGQVYMVVITSKAGVVQTYMADAQGRMVDEHGQKPVRPVMYKVLEWGKSEPATAQSVAQPADGGH